MKIEQGRPSNAAERADRERRTYDYLDGLAIPYVRADHEPAMTMEDCVAVDRLMEVEMCKNLFLCNRQQTDFYLLLMPGSKPFRTKELSAQLGTARLSFASAEHMLTYLDILPGAVSVMGLMNDTEGQVRLLIDEDLLSSEWFGCHPCVNTSSLRMRTEDILKVFLPAVKHTPTFVRLSSGETGEGGNV